MPEQRKNVVADEEARKVTAKKCVQEDGHKKNGSQKEEPKPRSFSLKRFAAVGAAVASAAYVAQNYAEKVRCLPCVVFQSFPEPVQDAIEKSMETLERFDEEHKVVENAKVYSGKAWEKTKYAAGQAHHYGQVFMTDAVPVISKTWTVTKEKAVEVSVEMEKRLGDILCEQQCEAVKGEELRFKLGDEVCATPTNRDVWSCFKVKVSRWSFQIRSKVAQASAKASELYAEYKPFVEEGIENLKPKLQQGIEMTTVKGRELKDEAMTKLVEAEAKAAEVLCEKGDASKSAAKCALEQGRKLAVTLVSKGKEAAEAVRQRFDL